MYSRAIQWRMMKLKQRGRTKLWMSWKRMGCWSAWEKKMQREELSTGKIPKWCDDMFVCLGKRWEGEGVEEWGDRKYWPQMLFETCLCLLGVCKVIWLLQCATNTHWYILEVSLEAQAVRITVSSVAETKICFGRHCVWAVIPTDLFSRCRI